MLDDVFQAFQDPDGNFLEQFQTTGFDTRCFELYLFAYFARSGFDIDRTNPMPDFLVARDGVRVAVEATTVNRPTGGAVKEHGRQFDELTEKEAGDYFANELPIRFGSPLFSKLQKKYWQLEQCRDLPFVIAIEAFHDDDAQAFSDNPLINYLYGSKSSARWTDGGKLEIQNHGIHSHKLGPKEIPSNFFGQPDTENISAVVFTNSATVAKFSRMGFQHGFDCDQIDMSRTGFWFNPNPNAMDPTFLVYNLDDPPFVEPWSQGLVVNHNPKCTHPLPRDFFVGAVQGYEEDGKFVADHSSWHPIMTKTCTLYLGPDKVELNKLPSRQSARKAVFAISKEEFRTICPHSIPEVIADEHGWYMDETNSFLGVLLHDKADDDWAWVVLARDEMFVFRCIDVQSCIPTRDQARIEVQLKLAERLSSPRRIFATGHPDGQ
jgi:hypothetical protein